MKILNFEGQRLEYKSSHKSLREYEKMTGKPVESISSYTDTTNLMYCIVKTIVTRAGLKFEMTVDEFIDWLDAHPDALEGIEKEPGPVPDDGEKKS
jgi:ADP-ribosylglycohydrolase